MEDFILHALSAYTESNGDIEQFEILLRSVYTTQPEAQSSFNISPEIAEELQSLDIESLTDEEVIELATRMGLNNFQ
jgi:hypothetical protein